MGNERKRKKTVGEYIKDACEAHADLYALDQVVALLESSAAPSSNRHSTVQRIIAICKNEQHRCLLDYDRAYSKATGEPDRKGQYK